MRAVTPHTEELNTNINAIPDEAGRMLIGTSSGNIRYHQSASGYGILADYRLLGTLIRLPCRLFSPGAPWVGQ